MHVPPSPGPRAPRSPAGDDADAARRKFYIRPAGRARGAAAGARAESEVARRAITNGSDETKLSSTWCAFVVFSGNVSLFKLSRADVDAVGPERRFDMMKVSR